MTQNKSSRIVSAGTWIVIQDALVNGAVVVAFLGLIGVIVATHTASAEVADGVLAITIVLPFSMVAVSWGLEEFRMNGMPYEEKTVEWYRGSK